MTDSAQRSQVIITEIDSAQRSQVIITEIADHLIKSEGH